MDIFKRQGKNYGGKEEWILDFEKKKKSEFNLTVYWDLTGCKQKLMWSSISSLRMRSCCSRCGLRSRFMRSWKKQEGRGQVEMHTCLCTLCPCSSSLWTCSCQRPGGLGHCSFASACVCSAKRADTLLLKCFLLGVTARLRCVRCCLDTPKFPLSF